MVKKLIDMDIAGMIASGICALHCLALPFIGLALPLAGLSFITGLAWEITFLAAAAFIGTSTLFRSVQHHGRKSPVLVFLAGITILIAAKFGFPHSHELFSPESVFSFLGGIAVVTAHLMNYRFRHDHVHDEKPVLLS